MKNFKEFNEAKKKENNYKTIVKRVIEDINTLIEYGRNIDMDNNKLNPLLDAIKSIYKSEEAINSSEEKDESLEPENKQ